LIGDLGRKAFADEDRMGQFGGHAHEAAGDGDGTAQGHVGTAPRQTERPDHGGTGLDTDAQRQRFQPGVRYFMGEPPTREHCIDVLKNGYQRQRIAAAEYLCLLNPGTPLFNTAAPAWRQQRLLAKMA